MAYLNRYYWFLWVAQAVSSVGDSIASLFMGWTVYNITGSQVAMGNLYIAFVIPEIVVRILGSPLVDRVDRRYLMFCMDFVRFVAFATLTSIVLLGKLQLWHLYAIAIIGGASAALFYPSGIAVLSSIVHSKEMVRANSILQSSLQGAQLLGAALAGVLLSFAGAASGFGINALTFAISALCIILLPRSVGVPSQIVSHHNTDRAYLAELVEGISFYKTHRSLLILLLIVSVANLTSAAIAPTIIPYGVEHVKTNAMGLGILQSSFSAGYLAGIVLGIFKGNFSQQRKPMMFSLFLWGVFQIALGLFPSLPVAVALRAGTGLATAVFNAFAIALLVSAIPKHLQGRALSFALVVVQAAEPLGAFFGTVIVEQYGILSLLIGGGLGIAIISLASLPLLRSLDEYRSTT